MFYTTNFQAHNKLFHKFILKGIGAYHANELFIYVHALHVAHAHGIGWRTAVKVHHLNVIALLQALRPFEDIEQIGAIVELLSYAYFFGAHVLYNEVLST